MKTIRATYTLLCVLSFAPIGVAQTLYGTQAGSIGAGNLYTINVANGAATLVGPLIDGSGNHYGMTGIAFQPGTGVLFGSTSKLSPTSPHWLVTIDPSTGRVTPIGSLVSTGVIADITFTPDGRLWGWWMPNMDRLVSINTSTGAATALGTNYLSTFGSGLASNSTGTIYFFGAGDGNNQTSPFYTLNLTSGQPTQVGTLTGGAYNDGAISSATFSSGGVIYAIDRNDTGFANSGATLISINLSTGVITKIGATDPNLDGLAIGTPGSPSGPGTAPAGAPALSTWAVVSLAILLAGLATLRLRPTQAGR